MHETGGGVTELGLCRRTDPGSEQRQRRNGWGKREIPVACSHCEWTRKRRSLNIICHKTSVVSEPVGFWLRSCMIFFPWAPGYFMFLLKAGEWPGLWEPLLSPHSSSVPVQHRAAAALSLEQHSSDSSAWSPIHVLLVSMIWLELSHVKVICKSLCYFWKAASKNGWQKDAFKSPRIGSSYGCFLAAWIGVLERADAKLSGWCVASLIMFSCLVTKAISDLSSHCNSLCEGWTHPALYWMTAFNSLAI